MAWSCSSEEVWEIGILIVWFFKMLLTANFVVIEGDEEKCFTSVFLLGVI